MMDEFDRLTNLDALYDDDDLLKTIGRALVAELRAWRPDVGWVIKKLQASGYCLHHQASAFRSVDVKISRSDLIVDEHVARSWSRKLEVDLADPTMMERLLVTLERLLDEERVFPGPEV